MTTAFNIRHAIGFVILLYGAYGITIHLISIFKYKAQIVWKPDTSALRRLWKVGDSIWYIAMLLVIFIFALGLVLCDFFGLIGPPGGMK